MSTLSNVIDSQLTSLDDTDCFSTAWQDALQRAEEKGTAVSWGGRGQGGRGCSRQTFQPKDVVVKNIRLEYVGTKSQGSCAKLLDGATLKLLSGKVYALIGRNGCGKSTLLRRIHAGKVPGFPPHVSTLYIPQEITSMDDDDEKNKCISPLDMLRSMERVHSTQLEKTTKNSIEVLEREMDQLSTTDENLERIQELAEEISAIEDAFIIDDGAFNNQEAQKALEFMGLDQTVRQASLATLSPGLRKKAALAAALICHSDLLLLDEPTNHLDVDGLIRLRQLVAACTDRHTTVLLVSHDKDLVNSVATNVIEFNNNNLFYYPGNYADYIVCRQRNDLHCLRQAVALGKKREKITHALENIKKKPIPRRGGTKKKTKQIGSYKKKLERVGLEKDDKGHRSTIQKAGTGIKTGSINAVDASSRRGLTTQQLLQMTEKSIRPPPDKAVQFIFRDPTSQFDEPLIMAMDVGHGYGISAEKQKTTASEFDTTAGVIAKRNGYLFDCVDLCIDEGGTYCILGSNSSGKSALLRLLALLEAPLEGNIVHAVNLDVALLDQKAADEMISTGQSEGAECALSFLQRRFPDKNEQILRAELTSFGLDPKQALTSLSFLSGGERSRLCLAALMLGDPQVLILDQPTSNLDVESVEALVHGLSLWKGTTVLVSHDANFVRSLEAECYALVAEEGKLRRVDGGIDTYLKSFGRIEK